VELPQDLVLDSIQEPCICFFKEKAHAAEAPPHFYVAIPVNDKLDLVVCIITSKASKRLEYYGERGIVLLPKKAFPFLTKDIISVVDCNRAILIPKALLPQIIDKKVGFSIKTRDLSDDLLRDILLAIEDSRIVKRFVQVAIKTSPISSRLFPHTPSAR
jgi:hypothetical protein